MSPSKALELVDRYARLTKAIKECKPRIGEHLDKCRGLKGFRLETEHFPAIPGNTWMPEVPAYEDPSQRAADDQETHLKGWFAMVESENHAPDDYGMVYQVIGAEHLNECAPCWHAVQVIQERKALRRQLAAVKGAMTRATIPEGVI